MSEKALPKQVREFINRYIHSVELLEVLLLVRAAPDKAWDPGEIARALTMTTDSAELRLGELLARGLVKKESGSSPPQVRYSPESADTDKTIDMLAEAYAKRRVTVIGVIFSGPSESVRSFGEAFRLRDD